MKKKTCLPRRQFLAGSALAACALLAPRIYGASQGATQAPSASQLEDAWNDEAVIAALAAYSSDVHLWKGPENFDPRAQEVERIERSVKYLVRVADIHRLVVFLNSNSMNRFGEVYAGGPNLAFVVGRTAYTVTNYGPEDFYRATN